MGAAVRYSVSDMYIIKLYPRRSVRTQNYWDCVNEIGGEYMIVGMG